jgi:hypothetical protein
MEFFLAPPWSIVWTFIAFFACGYIGARRAVQIDRLLLSIPKHLPKERKS